MDQLKHRNEAWLQASSIEQDVEKLFFDITFKHIKDMLFVMKVERGLVFRYLFANESGLQRTELTLEDMGSLLQEALPEEKANELQQQYEKVCREKRPVQYRDLNVYADWTFYGETILTPVFNEQGEVYTVVAVTRDVTETVLREDALAENEERYRSMFDHNLDAILSLDKDGVIIQANPNAHALLEQCKNALVGKSIDELMNAQDYVTFSRHFEQTLHGTATENFDCRFHHPSNKEINCQYKIVPIIVKKETIGAYLIFRDVEPQMDQIRKIRHMAYHDQLTGLYNRKKLLIDMDRTLTEDAIRTQRFAILTIDLDRFKYFNDTFGHSAGDLLLQTVADRLRSVVSEEAVVYRQGGDEFILFMFNADKDQTTRTADRILDAFQEPFVLVGQETYVTPSMGISLYPEDGDDAEMLLMRADAALHRVKQKGRGHYQFYKLNMSYPMANVVSMESHLRKALVRGEFEIHYQPQVNLLDGKISSFEALLRWRSRELGNVSPGDFIMLAEETGLILPIGDWVFEEVCRQLAEWKRSGFEPVRVAVNLSPKQFQQHDLPQRIERKLTKYNIDPGRLEIEITEGAMQDTEETIQILHRLKSIGLTISVDDFGKGYSSLNYLKQFPLDILKIDQSFVREILTDKKNAAITTTIIHLAQALGLEVIAEGVELVQQVDFLQQANCQKAQGFYFSRPLHADEIQEQFLLYAT